MQIFTFEKKKKKENKEMGKYTIFEFFWEKSNQNFNEKRVKGA